MRIALREVLSGSRLAVATTAGYWLWRSLLLAAVLLPGAGQTQRLDDTGTDNIETTNRIQVLEGRISASGLQLYRVTGAKKGEALYVHARATSGHLDPLIALIRPDVDLDELARESLDELVKTLSRDHDPIEVTRQILDRYALAGTDDSDGHYYSAFSAEIPEDGEYWLAIGSSLVRPSAGTYRLASVTEVRAAPEGRALPAQDL